jgi:hypothetical protein
VMNWAACAGVTAKAAALPRMVKSSLRMKIPLSGRTDALFACKRKRE